MTAFLDIAPCSLIIADWCFSGAYCLHHQNNEDGGSKHLLNIEQLLQDYTVQYLGSLSSSYPSLWEPEISKISDAFVATVKALQNVVIGIFC
jgi:hypothetical protein